LSAVDLCHTEQLKPPAQSPFWRKNITSLFYNCIKPRTPKTPSVPHWCTDQNALSIATLGGDTAFTEVKQEAKQLQTCAAGTRQYDVFARNKAAVTANLHGTEMIMEMAIDFKANFAFQQSLPILITTPDLRIKHLKRSIKQERR
jgi:hypothetical protein